MPTEKLRRPPPGPPRQPLPAEPPPAPLPRLDALEEQPPATAAKPSFFTKQTITLIALIAVAVIVGGLASAELYARSRADDVLTAVTECVVDDGASVSYGVNPPFLWQYLTGDYTNITVLTDGDRVQSATGMTAEVTLEDVRLDASADSKGTIGTLTAVLTWKSAGIQETIAANLPEVGKLVTGVRTDPAAGTLILDAGEGNGVTAKPVVTDGDLNLEVVDVKGPLPQDLVQSKLNELTKKLNDNYPLGIQADGVEITETGVVGKFSSRNASIPREDANPCFARL